MPWVRCAFGHVYLYQSMICSVVSPLPILNSRMLLPWSDYCSRTKSKNPFRARGTFVLRGTFVRTLWPSGVCNEMRWWWDSLVDKGPHCISWSCWTADEQLGRSPAGRGKVRVGCDKNICICICICICWRDEQHEWSTPQSWKEGHSRLGCVTKNLGHCCHHFGGRCRPRPPFTYYVSPKILEFTFFASDGCGETSSRLQRLLMTPMSRPRLSQEALMMVNNGNPQILGLALFIRLPSTTMLSGPSFWFKANQILCSGRPNHSNFILWLLRNLHIPPSG